MTAAEEAALARDTDPDGVLRCARCGKAVRLADGRVIAQYSKHHRKKRRYRDADRVENIVVLDGSGTTGCHGLAHSSKWQAAMLRDGWVVKGWDNPVLVVCARTNGRQVFFEADGTVTDLEPRPHL